MLIAGNINSYLKQSSLRIKANMRLENGGVSPDELAEQAASQKKQITMSAIVSKLDFGKKLTQEELQYLRENDPQLYAKAVKIAMERAQYERRLRRCKTREEARELHLSTTAACAQEIRSAKGAEEKTLIRWRVMAFQDAYQTYSTSGCAQSPHIQAVRQKPDSAVLDRRDGFIRSAFASEKQDESTCGIEQKNSSPAKSEKHI